jgi:streptomycin 6-kinase
MEIPPGLARAWQHETAWLKALPALVAACAEDWQLELGDPFDGNVSLVVPSGDAVLKLTAPSDREADEEAAALDAWNGRGAVKLLAWDPGRRALLIERCRPGTRLWDWDDHALEVAIELLAKLTTPGPPGHAFRSLRHDAAGWAEEVPRRFREGGRPFEQSLLDHAVAVYEDARDDGYLANQDLHGGNILRAEREPWLVIDPKPLSGERELGAVGLLRNAASDDNDHGTSTVAAYLDALASIGFDRERSQAWGMAHALAWGYDEQGWNDWSIEIARTIRAA